METMNDTPETDAEANNGSLCDQCVPVDFARKLERERDEAREYADKLAGGLPDGMLPKDVEVLREANLGLAMELADARGRIEANHKATLVIERMVYEAREQRDAVTFRLGETQERMIDAERQRDRLADALRSIKNELGVPQPEYPAPVANAVKIADEALNQLNL